MINEIIEFTKKMQDICKEHENGVCIDCPVSPFCFQCLNSGFMDVDLETLRYELELKAEE